MLEEKENIETENIKKTENKEVSLDKWIDFVPGTIVGYLNNTREGSSELLDQQPEWFNIKEEDKMTFNVNNSVLAFVDQERNMKVAPATNELIEELKKTGYKENGSLGVPLSNGEVPVDPTLNLNWMRIMEKGDEQMKKDRIEGHLQEYKKIAEEKGIKQIEKLPNEWLLVDGVEVEGLGGRKEEIEQNTDGFNMGFRRLEQVGTYDTNNGITAFVDEKGCMYVGPVTSEKIKKLEDAGYKKGSIGIPFSNGDFQTNPELRLKWQKILELEENKKKILENIVKSY